MFNQIPLNPDDEADENWSIWPDDIKAAIKQVNFLLSALYDFAPKKKKKKNI